MSARNVFTMSVDSHNLSMSCNLSRNRFLTNFHIFHKAIVEADGVATQPLIVDQLDLLAGQRYSVIVSNTLVYITGFAQIKPTLALRRPGTCKLLDQRPIRRWISREESQS